MTIFTNYSFSISGSLVNPQTMPTRIAQQNINIMDLVALVGDGITDNYPLINTGLIALKNFNPSFPATVTIDIANPAVIHWTNHGLRVNEAIVFSTTGSLPTGIAAGQTYYVIPTGLTASQFQITDTNAYPTNGIGPAIVTSGSQSGTHSAQTQGVEAQTLFFPPGNYHSTVNFHVNKNQKYLIVDGYGASFDNLFPLAYGLGYNRYNNNFSSSALIQTVNASTGVNNPTLTLVNIADHSKFDIGGWIAITALDLQNSLNSYESNPPNSHYCEFNQIRDIDSGTGVITLQNALRNGYPSTFPLLWGGDGSAGPSGQMAGGPGVIIPMSSDWDMELIIKGIHLTNTGGEFISSARILKMVDCIFDGFGVTPTVVKEFFAENCIWTQGLSIEVDKIIEHIHFTNCDFSTLLIQSSSVDRINLDNCSGIVTGTPRNMQIDSCQLFSLTIGANIGTSESLIVKNSYIGQLSYFILTSGKFRFAAHNYSFSAGVLSQPLQSQTANSWAVPGRAMFVKSLKNAIDGGSENMGSPFTVLDVSTGSSSSSTVTITVGTPAVINWTSHGLVAGTVIILKTTGNLPSGLSMAVPYYVLAAGLGTDSFEVSTSAGGTAVSTSGSQSGTHTALASPTFSIRTTLTSMPVGSSTSSTVTIDVATPAVIHWTSHGLTANTPVAFKTTGSLPTGIDNSTLYYVIASGLGTDSFEISTSVGGSAVNTSGSQSGTHTAIANPLFFEQHPCPRVTFENCTGNPVVLNLSKAPKDAPLFSYASARLIGNFGVGSSVYLPRSLFVYGTLVTMTINVIRADTSGSGIVLNITASAFKSDLTPGDMSLVINPANTGLRTITATTATGAKAGDTIAAFANWISGEITAECNGPTTGTFVQSPIVEITVTTDQGYTNVMPILWAFGANPNSIDDTNYTFND